MSWRQGRFSGSVRKTPIKLSIFLATKKSTANHKGGNKTSLHKRAWKVFSRWIRERDKICVCCGSRGDLDASHFWHGVLDFCEININATCRKCNRFMGGNLAPYSIYLLRKHGQQAFEDLEKRHYLALRGEYRTDQDYLDIIEKYTL